MKLLPRPRPLHSDENLNRGMDIALVTVVFVVIGWLVDRWLGTQPVFIITLLVLGVVGQFLSIRYRYEAVMQRLEAERRERSQSSQQQVAR